MFENTQQKAVIIGHTLHRSKLSQKNVGAEDFLACLLNYHEGGGGGGGGGSSGAVMHGGSGSGAVMQC